MATSLATADEPTQGATVPQPVEAASSEPCVVLVRNDDDGVGVREHLKFFGEITTRAAPAPRVLVRPTPGASDQTTLALDMLTALGKNPHVLAGERLGASAWSYARAWLAAAQVSDLVVDRAQQLPVTRWGELTELAVELGCRVWLIWSGPGDSQAALDSARWTGVRCASVMPEWLAWLLPIPARSQQPDHPFSDTVLPLAEFTTFRAAVRRHLPPHQFETVDRLYLDAAGAADAWLADHQHLRADGREGIGGPLAAWLRDDQLGPHHRPSQALIVLRATQAALFVGGVLLRWNPAALGPDPAARLCGTIDTRQRVHELYVGARTAPAAITALSLHLNQPPLYFDCWRLGDVATDGSQLSPPGVHRHKAPAYLSYPDHQAAIATTSGVTEIPCAHTVRIPAPAQILLAAHHAYRRHQGATADDPFFADPTKPADAATYSRLRSHAVITAARLHHTPGWLHLDDCRYGADIGLHRRPSGWLIERGLSVHLLDPALTERVPHPVRRPPWR